MGKKNKDKKGKGMEKTERKTEKNAAKRARREQAERGEEDVEKKIAESVAQGKQVTQVTEERCPPPSPRCNMTFVPHPDKEELVMFGGEYCTGSAMTMYNDLFYYNIRKNEWVKVISPNPPPPRSSHQAVMVAQRGGQMWVFGGEFSGKSQNQFHHYRDMWVLNLQDKTWEQIKTPGPLGPSARSGHRMAFLKNQLILFGGFHDNNKEFHYYNDLWAFDLGSYTWSQLQPAGYIPSPRSGCVLCPTLTGSRLVMYGGYSKRSVKRDVESGTMHTDMFALQPEGKGPEGKPVNWRWIHIRQSGTKPSPRCSMSAVVAPGNHAVLFGGVQDVEEDEEQLEGTFFNDMYTVDLQKGAWSNIQLRGNRKSGERKRRRKAKQPGVEDGNEDMETDEVEDAEDCLLDLDLENNTQEQNPEPVASTSRTSVEGIFTVTIGPQSTDVSKSSATATSGATSEEKDLFVPCGRMTPCLAMRNGVLYLYGGTYELGNRQITLSDFYSLDLIKLDEWKTIIAQNLPAEVWQESSSDSEDDAKEKGKEKKRGLKRPVDDDSDDSDEDNDDDEEVELTFDDAPSRETGEDAEAYFMRTQDYWLQQARNIMDSEGINLSDRKLLKIAKEICEEAFNS